MTAPSMENGAVTEERPGYDQPIRRISELGRRPPFVPVPRAAREPTLTPAGISRLSPATLLACCALMGITVQVEGDQLILAPADRVPRWMEDQVQGREAEIVTVVLALVAELDQIEAEAEGTELETPKPLPRAPRLRAVPR